MLANYSNGKSEVISSEIISTQKDRSMIRGKEELFSSNVFDKKQIAL